MSTDTIRPLVPQVEVEESAVAAAELLLGWLNEDDGYDSEVWPIVEAALKEEGVCIGESDEPGA